MISALGLHALAQCRQDRLVHAVQTLVLQDQAAAPLEQARRAAEPAQARAVDGPRGEGVDLDLRAEVAREDLRQHALARLGDGVVGAVRVGHGDVLLAAEVARDVQHHAGPRAFISGANLRISE
jgi:hypothetical protein